jgi:hypothetical protein
MSVGRANRKSCAWQMCSLCRLQLAYTARHQKEKTCRAAALKTGLELPAQTKCMINDMNNGTFNHENEQKQIR